MMIIDMDVSNIAQSWSLSLPLLLMNFPGGVAVLPPQLQFSGCVVNYTSQETLSCQIANVQANAVMLALQTNGYLCYTFVINMHLKHGKSMLEHVRPTVSLI